MQPQRLDRSRPLVSEDRAAGTRSGLRQGVSPCDRAGAASPGGGATAPTRPSLYGSGSGPGGYGQYIPGAPPPTDPSGNKQSAAAADRPLYGGTERPLWDTGARRPAAAAAKPAPTTTASSGEPGKDPASAAPAPPSMIPAPVRDRPLWVEGGLSGPLAPAPAAGSASDSAAASTASADTAGGIAVAPCTAAAPR